MNAHTTKTSNALLWSEPHASTTGLMVSLAHAFRALSEWSQRRRMAAELNSLSDRELTDIGLTRGEIGAIIQRR